MRNNIIGRNINKKIRRLKKAEFNNKKIRSACIGCEYCHAIETIKIIKSSSGRTYIGEISYNCENNIFKHATEKKLKSIEICKLKEK